MPKLKKLFEKIVRNPNDVDFHDLDKLLIRYGFNCRQPRKGSSHFTYYHPQLDEILTIPKDRPLKAVYVKKAIEAIKKLQNGGDVE
ncbi:type II toxin-antitoxin system HicA family toxin [Desulfofundulus thermocisternus]|jgi:predicted RNA binding protein YcfA (HicA-like mRNA interferase family)|uniref:type II toxin-antitoxin system HicA family toxin n=1 Tax=Desulfofundulus thermocisternus TaxID=42471 RepID=UPI0019FC69B7|nr:type II toxin-antitoxin system HicA family toxin [Desulfofundulus thermocisternus]MBE3585046.1 type II toxin-antitoxin system HicA family toxin [Thermoanaerobacter sp.]MCS5694543.1 type II toxin-antitoxin system HicA family toxin [Desulfofundulus thermocisternus]